MAIMITIVAGVASSAAMLAKNGKDVKVKSNSVLVIDMSKRIVERAQQNPFEGLNLEGFDDNSTLELRDVLDGIERAAQDTNIKGIMLKGAYFAGGMSSMQSVREYLEAFKSSGKFIIAYEEMMSQGAYYVASVADEVYVFQEGGMDFRGLSSEVPFFKGAMDKLGIDATIVKGPNNIYKSAVEPFYREDMSEPAKEQMSRILGNIWGDMLADISESRGITVEECNRIADEMAIRKPEDAVSLKLIDGLVYYDEILANLKEKLSLEEDEDIESIGIGKYAMSAEPKDKDDKSWELKDEVAVIYAVGGISSGEGDEENIGSETLAKAIRDARKDEDVKAIVLRVNSPGGSAMASEVIWRETVLAGEAKPFVVSFGDVAASGGYYISTHADRIFGLPNTITGSIGAFGMIPNLRGFFNEKLGIKFDGVKTNEHADFGTLKRDFDEEEISVIQGYLNQVYIEFVEKVAEGRGTTYEMIDSIGRGRVWTGHDALENGLIDEYGDLNDAIAYAAEQAELEDYDVKELPEKKDPFEELMKDFSGETKMWLATQVLGDEVKWIKKMEEMKKMDDIQARMLYDFEIR